MKYYNLDMVIRGHLLNKRYSIHWYVPFLVYGITALRDMAINSAGVVNTKLIKVNEAGEAVLPCDYVDKVRVGTPNGIYNRPLVTNSNFNNLNRYNDQGEVIPYEDIPEQASPFVRTWESDYVDQYGQRTAGWFNHDQGAVKDTFKIIETRGVIQFHPALKLDYAILDYISDGITCDAATRVLPGQIKYLQEFIEAEHRYHSRNYNLGERQEAANRRDKALRNLIASNNDLTIEDLIRIVRRSKTGTVKT